MNTYGLKNNLLTIHITDQGAELISIRDIAENEYMWQADERYWKRHSPILFPIVGSLKDGCYTYEGESYKMSQHGFARDSEFKLINQTDDTIWFELRSNEQSKQSYPFEFCLQVGYQLMENEIKVMWKVNNEDDKPMYYSIGAHPAFNCPLFAGDEQSQYSFKIKKDTSVLSNLKINKITQNGLKKEVPETILLNEGLLRISEHLFDEDALIVEGQQANEVSLVNAKQVPNLTVVFDAPLFGLWSPAGKKAPFVCIEPWFGRCDSEEFEGNLNDREYSETLHPGESKVYSYCIIIDKAAKICYNKSNN